MLWHCRRSVGFILCLVLLHSTAKLTLHSQLFKSNFETLYTEENMKQSWMIGILGAVIVVVVIIVLSVTLTSNGEGESSGTESIPSEYFTSCSSGEKNSPFGRYSSAAASSDAEHCASIAVDILKRNGTAADASIAAMFCVGVMNAQSSGLGGGFVATYYSKKEGKVYTLDAREAAPKAAYPQMYDPSFNKELKNKTGNWWEEKGSANLKGGLAVAVPGEVAGFFALYKKFGGKLPWKSLIQPTIELCEKGYNLTWYTGGIIYPMKEDFLREPSMRIFMNEEENRVLRPGEMVRRLQLAKTLRKLQIEPESLYNGDLAEDLVKDLKSFGGIITKEDLIDYRPIWREPVKVYLKNGNYTMYTFPPPGSGIILGLILRTLDEYGLTKESLNSEMLDLTNQIVAEAFKFSYAQRYRLGDLSESEIQKLVNEILDEKFVSEVKSKIPLDETKSDPLYYGTKIVPDEDAGTAHFSLVAPNGDAVAITSSINYEFGAGIRSQSTGIIFNNQMADFTTRRELVKSGQMKMEKNLVLPGERPLSSMSPTIVLDAAGQVRLVIGAAGGIRIPSAIAWVTARNLWMSDGLKDAIDACRSHHSLIPDKLQYEKGFPKSILQGLRRRGHKTEEHRWKAVVIAIGRDDRGYLESNADYRKSGEVDGF